jgi:hypothetical protein
MYGLSLFKIAYFYIHRIYKGFFSKVLRYICDSLIVHSSISLALIIYSIKLRAYAKVYATISLLILF